MGCKVPMLNCKELITRVIVLSPYQGVKTGRKHWCSSIDAFVLFSTRMNSSHYSDSLWHPIFEGLASHTNLGKRIGTNNTERDRYPSVAINN